jgi:RNA polymerase sigma-70 factor (ECF subfamily)
VDADDAALLVAARAGDGAAFETFYRRWLPVVTRFHLRRGGSREAAFDLTAETFAGVVASLADFDPERGSAAAWLFGIAEHKLGTSRRRGRVEARARRELGYRRVALEDEDLARVEELVSLDGPQRVKSLLAELPSEQEAAVRARVLDERSYVEIATELSCSEAVVRQRVHRGLRRLRERMAATVALVLALAVAGSVVTTAPHGGIGRASATRSLSAEVVNPKCSRCRTLGGQLHGPMASGVLGGGTGSPATAPERRGLAVVSWSQSQSAPVSG